jgi:hypothetical protein
MLFDKKPRWLRQGKTLINLDHVDFFTENGAGVDVYVNGSQDPFALKGSTLDDIHHLIKHGRLRKRKALKS